MSNWEYAAEVPTQQFRSANTLPREMKLFKGADGDIYLASVPVQELEALRGEVVAESGKATLGATPLKIEIPASTEGLYEITAQFDADKKGKVELTLGNSAGEEAVIVYDAATRTASFDRTRAGVSDFSQSFPAVTVAPTHEKTGRVELRVFVDRSSVEVFGNGGEFVMTNLVFPTEPYLNLSVSAPEGGAKLSGIKVYAVGAEALR